MKKLPEELKGYPLTYANNESWQRFIDFYGEDPGDALSEFNIPKDIKKMIYGYFGEKHAKSWLHSNTPAFYGFRPIDVLNDYKDGEAVTRTILHRTPR